jgi:Galactose oxidase, central domain
VLIVACNLESVASSNAPVDTLSPTTTTEPPAIEPTTTVPSEATAFDLGPLTPRTGHSVIWTGEEVIVWGGESGDDPGTPFSDGAAFDPVGNSWRLIAESPLSPRTSHAAAWTGDEMLIVGGFLEGDGAAYDPTTDSWRLVPDPPVPLEAPNRYDAAGSVWTGQEMIIWDISSQQVAAYAPDLDTWRALPSIDLTGDTGLLRWTGEALYAFADNLTDYPSATALGSARLNQEGGWESIAPADFSTDDRIAWADATLTVWTGDRFIAWTSSGTEGKTLKLSPSDTSWTETDPVPVHSCEGVGEPTQPGPLVTAFDSCDSSILVLDPDTGSWSASRVTGYPTARYTVWAGAELINWGGGCCPTVDAWRYTPIPKD